MNEQKRTSMSKRRFRIGELSRELEVKKFVIRFWEKEFGIKSDRSQGGQRYYSQEDFKAFNTIKHLLYTQGYTIAGAKVQLEKTLTKKQDITQVKAAVKSVEKAIPYIPKEFIEKIQVLKKQLFELKEKLG